MYKLELIAPSHGRRCLFITHTNYSFEGHYEKETVYSLPYIVNYDKAGSNYTKDKFPEINTWTYK